MTERFMPVPDSVLQTAAATVTTNATADPMLDSAGLLTWPDSFIFHTLMNFRHVDLHCEHACVH
jgi:hypothetical protein